MKNESKHYVYKIIIVNILFIVKQKINKLFIIKLKGDKNVMIHNRRLKELRIDKDLKQEDIAEYLQITKQAYGMYENRKRDIPTETIKQLCLYFNVSADYILGLPKGLKYPER